MDNVNFPEQEYSDFFGGTKGTAEAAEYAENTIGLKSGTSQAMANHSSAKRVAKIRAVAEEVNSLNEAGN